MGGRSKRLLGAAALAAAAVVLVCGGAWLALRQTSQPGDAGTTDTAPQSTPEPQPASGTTFAGTTQAGLYQFILTPVPADVPLRTFHAWRLQLLDAKHQAFQPAELFIRGGMPDHGHGLPSDPQVVANAGPGQFLIEGVKFNMAGTWVFQLNIRGPAGPDIALVEFRVDN